jgi:signal transduction histidine kinase
MKNKIALKVTLIYFLISFFWILFSDQLILKLGETGNTITTIQTYKGWFFVCITSILLYFLIRSEIRKKNQIESDLVHAKMKAEESEHLKSAFLSNMSHEIRTPLNGILGFCELLVDDSFKENDKQIFAKNLTQNGNDLLRLINDILDISRIQENQFEIAKKKFHLNSLLDHIYSEYLNNELIISGKTIDFKVIKGSQNREIEMYSDPVRLTHIIHKLLNNSFFFTNEGFIHFGYIHFENGIEFFVEDSGCGIEESNQELFFKPFYKGKRQVIGNKGFGLGLAISKGLTNLLGGDLKFSSTPGNGSRFYFRLEKNNIFPSN